MKHLYSFLVLVIFSTLYSCNKSDNSNFTVNGTIKGLKKGTIYLEKLNDSLFKPIDSFMVRHNGKFTLSDNIESPEIYYLRIKEKPNESILIFGEKGTIKVSSKLEKFSISAIVSGSTNHDFLVEYKKMIQQFNDSRLDVFAANLKAEQDQNQVKIDSLNKIHKSLIRRRYLYTTNYAVTHADKEIAPYLALTELYNANIALLDTINNSLTDKIKESKYGRQLDRFITVVKKNETKLEN